MITLLDTYIIDCLLPFKGNVLAQINYHLSDTVQFTGLNPDDVEGNVVALWHIKFKPQTV
jgi:hypothetical protein